MPIGVRCGGVSRPHSVRCELVRLQRSVTMIAACTTQSVRDIATSVFRALSKPSGRSYGEAATHAHMQPLLAPIRARESSRMQPPWVGVGESAADIFTL